MEFIELPIPDKQGYTRSATTTASGPSVGRPSMRQVHLAGDKMFVDYSGKKPQLVEPTTGEVVEVELFVAVLGASSYTYAEATRTQTLADFTASHVRAFAFFGGVTDALVPDQLKSAVTIACRYEPGVQRTYAELGRHYGTTILPARPRSPRDKAKVEVAVQVAQRWILARMRNETFYSLGALNARIAELCAELNGRVMRHYKASRLRALRAARQARAPCRCRRSASCTPSGRRRGSTSTTTSKVRRALLLGAVHARARGAVGAVDGGDGGALPPRRARGVAPAQRRPRPSHDGRGATCRPRTRSTRSGRRRASSAGRARSAR